MYHIHYYTNHDLITLYLFYCINNERIAYKKATKASNRGLDCDQCLFI